MKDKLYNPARQNEKSPAEGMASVNTHNPDDEQDMEQEGDQKEDNDSREKQNNKNNDRT